MAKNNFLERITLKVKEQVEREKKQWPVESLEEAFKKDGRFPSFKEAFLKKKYPSIISEIKFGSPSAGTIRSRSEGDSVEIAGQYLKERSSALSIVTEPFYFKGDINDIKRVSLAYPKAKILRKDFIIDEFQILHSRVLGASCVLLIVSLIGRERLKDFLDLTKKYEIEALVEVHDEDEFKIALESGAKIIGVNNRNLSTFEVSLETSLRLAKLKQKETILISESGIKTSQEVKLLEQAGYDGFLIGSSFMKAKKPGDKLREILDVREKESFL
ncbi:indole-3-glycerol phosphate synthase TrpC [Bacteriovoracales bacterium]|nr:indole-3-glycerol phosphate synthase TrpC [Bacteriovoracales bacterium]